MEVQWIDEGFRGLLPFPFNSSLGGMAAAPPHFNDKNKASLLRHQTLHLLCGARFAKAISNSRKQLIDMRENLLVTMDLVKIADFGLAREVHSKPPFTEYASTCCSIVG
ncbi:hypothetical protein ZIOFF_075800 [Zingiber officinale]|uniref:Protein kinase domain-containing protein n=1 Tax=Zingiber officinale TaxID=94328 RepID=A0A8J5C0S5_ZINOF|nr:hypothetical protein ZIOFF_075800 [Zingiber officinale]